MANVIVCGGRDFDDWRLLSETLHKHLPTDAVICHGPQIGAAFLARVWAKHNGRMTAELPDDPLSLRPVFIIAFPGGGSAELVRRARVEGVLAYEVRGKGQ